MLTNIIKNTFSNLNKQGLKATPEEYKKAFCQEAKKLGVNNYKCSDDSLYETLSKKNSRKLKKLNINNMNELLNYIEDSFENFMSNEDLQGLICIVRDALQPSLGVVINDEIDSFNKSIKNNPQNLTKKEIQDKVHNLFELRCKLDKKTMTSTTKKLVKMLASVTNEFTNTLTATTISNEKILEIKDNIENLDTSVVNDKEINNIKDDMLNIAKSFEYETNKFSKQLKKDSGTISKMAKRIELLEKSLKDAKHDSVTDFMTGIMTRRGFDQYIEKLDLEYKNDNTEYSAIFFDIDHFKKVNDTYGHDAGDSILITFAKLLKIELSNHGEVFRFGGEEFVSILPKKDVLQSLALAEKIRKTVERSNFIYEDLKLNITFSAGIAQRSAHDSVDTLITCADDLLYKAKQNGRNQVVI